MVWGERAGNEATLSYEAFISLAREQGFDLTDDAHLALLYDDVLGMLRTLAELTAVSVGSTEPSDVYMPGSEIS